MTEKDHHTVVPLPEAKPMSPEQARQALIQEGDFLTGTPLQGEPARLDDNDRLVLSDPQLEAANRENDKRDRERFEAFRATPTGARIQEHQGNLRTLRAMVGTVAPKDPRRQVVGIRVDHDRYKAQMDGRLAQFDAERYARLRQWSDRYRVEEPKGVWHGLFNIDAIDRVMSGRGYPEDMQYIADLNDERTSPLYANAEALKQVERDLVQVGPSLAIGHTAPVWRGADATHKGPWLDERGGRISDIRPDGTLVVATDGGRVSRFISVENLIRTKDAANRARRGEPQVRASGTPEASHEAGRPSREDLRKLLIEQANLLKSGAGIDGQGRLVPSEEQATKFAYEHLHGDLGEALKAFRESSLAGMEIQDHRRNLRTLTRWIAQARERGRSHSINSENVSHVHRVVEHAAQAHMNAGIFEGGIPTNQRREERRAAARAWLELNAPGTDLRHIDLDVIERIRLRAERPEDQRRLDRISTDGDTPILRQCFDNLRDTERSMVEMGLNIGTEVPIWINGAPGQPGRAYRNWQIRGVMPDGRLVVTNNSNRLVVSVASIKRARTELHNQED